MSHQGNEVARKSVSMIVVGLIGGVACGKSAVAQDFRKLGAGIVDGDEIGHQVLRQDNVKAELSSKWPDVVDESGDLNRARIASYVFAKKSKAAAKNLDFLESVTHPEIEQRMAARIQRMAESGRFRVVILDAAVMVKAGWHKMCQKIGYVDAPLDLRRKRAVLRGMTIDQFESRERAQTDVNAKREIADFVIDNSGPPQKTYLQVQKVWQSLLEIA